MTRIGVTGHQGLPADVIEEITEQVTRILQEMERPLIGYSSLAEGADQLVAQLILNAGGQLHAVIPSKDYDTTFSSTPKHNYARLLGAAAAATHLSFPEPSEEAYDAAGKWVAEHCDVLIAVWDGLPARGLGGTANAVAHARALSRDVRIVWPPGARR